MPLFLLIFALLLQAGSLDAQIWEWGAQAKDFAKLELYGTEVFQAKDFSQDLRLRQNSFLRSPDNLLYINFDAPEPRLLQEHSLRSSIAKAHYLASMKSRKGKRAALFNSADHALELYTENFLNPKTRKSRSFTIELWFKPLLLSASSTLLENVTWLADKKKGIVIHIQKDYLVIDFLRLFKDQEKALHSVRLQSLKKAQRGKWQHLACSYEEHTGSLILYWNGKEEDKKWAASKEEIWSLDTRSLEASVFRIAKRFTGYIDELRISQKALSAEQELRTSLYPILHWDMNSLHSRQEVGEARSEVLSLPAERGAHSGQISFTAKEPRGTAVYVYARHSQDHFTADDSKIPWEVIPSQAEDSLQFPAFRYFQWKAALRADPEGQQSPVLEKVRLVYTPFRALLPPRALRSILSQGLQVCLEWEHELGLQRSTRDQGKAGYRIYYGLQPGVYIGALSLELSQENRSEYFSKTAEEEACSGIFKNRIRVLLDNALIRRNLEANPAAFLRFLEHGRSYYFAVSQYHNADESKLSNEIWVKTLPKN